MDGHLDLLGLDAVRAGDATPEERAHADACADCRASIAGFHDLAARLAPAPLDVPADVRRRILALARPRRLWRPLAAAAAALAIGLSVWLASRPSAPRRMDIVDAYSVALRLREGRAVEPKWDLNGDGKVDAQDVEEIARRSVSIR
jgi:hypothetical protein